MENHGEGIRRDLDRDDLVRRFERWLDDTLADEDPPGGIDSEMLAAVADEPIPPVMPDMPARPNGARDDPTDSYMLWAAMTALTHEVKLQGRAFKELDTTLGTQASRTAEDVHLACRERERDVRRDAEHRSQKDMLGAWIDLRDVLARGLETVGAARAQVSRRPGRRWLHRLLGPSTTDPHAKTLVALTNGYELGLQRLDQTLGELNARPVRCEGQPFDPQRMSAVDREESSEVPEGTVLEVYRTGYEWGGTVFRPAQVKVACAPAAGPRHE